MRVSNVLRSGSLLLLAGALACSGDSTQPVAPGAEPTLAKAAAEDHDVVGTSAALEAMNAKLAASGSRYRVFKAELIVDPRKWDMEKATTIFANNRVRGLAYEWVSGDPRRDGRAGVTYAVSTSLTTPFAPGFTLPVTPAAGAPGFASVPQAELDARIEEAMDSWRAQSCSSAPITRVPSTPNPEQLDELFLGFTDPVAYEQPADIVQSGWLAPDFFDAFGGPGGGDGIIGVAFSFWFVDDATGEPTDINNDRRLDTGLVEIYYNGNFFWDQGGNGNAVDFYSIIAHETGHSLGLAHYGKLFATDASLKDGFQLEDIKYAPFALMNAAYVTGRVDIQGTDNSSFCMVWGSKK